MLGAARALGEGKSWYVVSSMSMTWAPKFERSFWIYGCMYVYGRASLPHVDKIIMSLAIFHNRGRVQ